MTDKKCKCPMSISVLGDGCRYCQPQEYIDRLHEQIEKNEAKEIKYLEVIESVRDMIMLLNGDCWGNGYTESGKPYSIRDYLLHDLQVLTDD